MVAAKSNFPKLKAVRFEFVEGGGTGINMGLLLEAVVPAFRHEHKGDPVISHVARATERFKALARQNLFHCVFSLGEALLARPRKS